MIEYKVQKPTVKGWQTIAIAYSSADAVAVMVALEREHKKSAGTYRIVS